MFFFRESAENAARAFSSEDPSGGTEKYDEVEDGSDTKEVSDEKKPTLQETLDAKEKASLITKNEDGVYETIVPEESQFSRPIQRKKRESFEPDSLDESGDTIVPEESKYYKKPKDEKGLEL
jgi:hypothetical protein